MAKKTKKPGNRKAAYIAALLEDNEKVLSYQSAYELTKTFKDRPLQECVELLTADLPAEEIFASHATLLLGKRSLEETQQHLAYITTLQAIEEQLGLEELGLSLVLGHNRYSTEVPGHSREGEWSTNIDGEVLLVSAKTPTKAISFFATGLSTVHNGSTGGDPWLREVNEAIVMYVDKEPCWPNFDAPDSSETWSGDDKTLEEVETEKAAGSERLLTKCHKAFPGVTLHEEEISALLGSLASFFAPDGRPRGYY